MYYCLNEGLALVSFKGLPYGLRGHGKTIFIGDREEYLLLYKCNGKNDIDRLDLNETQKKFIANLVEKNILTGFDEQHPLDGPIPSHIYPNNYRQSVHWSITGRCNYKCRHCFQSAPEGALGQPGFDVILNMIDQFVECGIEEVSLTGGEPLIRNDFFDIVDAILEHKIRISTIYSNGALVSEDLIKKLETRNIKPDFQISFDGVGFHDWMRGIPGAEKQAIEAIRLLRVHGFNVSCAFSLCRENAASLLDSIRLLDSLGVSGLKIQRCFPQGEWRNEPDHYIEDDQLLTIYMNLLDQVVRAGIRMPVQMEGVYLIRIPKGQDKYMVSVMVDMNLTKEEFEKKFSCGVTAGNFYVGPNGAVVPCMSMCGAKVEEIFPNMLQTPLREILADSDFLRLSCAKVKDVIGHNDKCRDCSFAYHCGGGKCRATAVGDKSSDYYCADDFCCYIFKSGWDIRLREKAESLMEEFGGTFVSKNANEETGM